MKIETLTYEIVRNQINEMVLAGEKITVRNVRGRVGGKMATVADYLKQWHLEQRIQISDDDFSIELKKAIIIDRKNITDMVIASYDSKYLDLAKTLVEVGELLNEKEDTCTKLESEFKTLKLETDAHKIKLETQLNGLEKANSDLKKQLELLQNKLDTTTNDKYAVVKDCAVWESKYNELSKQMQDKK